MYLYNSRLCQELYSPINITEVVFRNGIAEALKIKHGEAWHLSPVFLRNMSRKSRNIFVSAVNKETAIHGTSTTSGHVITSLTIGFWVKLLSPRGPSFLNAQDLIIAFPNAPAGFSATDLYQRVKSFRDFRNKIFHHSAIFDQSPTREYHNMREIVKWRCEDTLWLMSETSNPIGVMSNRPTI